MIRNKITIKLMSQTSEFLVLNPNLFLNPDRPGNFHEHIRIPTWPSRPGEIFPS